MSTEFAPKFRFTMRDIVLMVTLGVVFGFLYWALVQAWLALQVAMGPAGDMAQHVLLGSWLLVAPITLAITRKPGAGVIAEVLASVIEVVFLGSPVGATLLFAAFIQGAGSELGFAIFRYRKYSWPTFALSGALVAGLVFFFSAYRFDWYGQSTFMWRFLIQVSSGVVLGGLLAWVIVLALRKTGVLDNFAIGRDAAVAAPVERVL